MACKGLLKHTEACATIPLPNTHTTPQDPWNWLRMIGAMRNVEGCPGRGRLATLGKVLQHFWKTSKREAFFLPPLEECLVWNSNYTTLAHLPLPTSAYVGSSTTSPNIPDHKKPLWELVECSSGSGVRPGRGALIQNPAQLQADEVAWGEAYCYTSYYRQIFT